MTEPIELDGGGSVVVSEVYQDSRDAATQDAHAVIFDIGEQAISSDWNGNLLALGTEDAKVLILSPIVVSGAYGLPTTLQQKYVFRKTYLILSEIFTDSVDHLRFNSKYIVVGSYASSKVVLINHTDYQNNRTKAIDGLSQVNVTGLQHKVFGDSDDKYLHQEPINCVDVSDDGIVATTGDSRQVIVYNDPVSQHQPVKFELNNPGLKVKFLTLNNEEYLLVLESTNVLRVLDWRNKHWMTTVYPIPYDPNNSTVEISDFFTNSRGQLLVVGNNGWFTKYNLANLTGGAGFTPPSQKGTLSGFKNPNTNDTPVKVISSSLSNTNSQYSVFNLSKHLVASYSFDHVLKNAPALNGSANGSLAESIVNGKSLKINLPSHEISTGSVNSSNVAAITSGSKMLLLSV